VALLHPGWPEKTADLDAFYPTSALVTGYDIIFFWVARMIMAGMEFMGKAPFRDIYITSLVRDKQGRKMSKSLWQRHRSLGDRGRLRLGRHALHLGLHDQSGPGRPLGQGILQARVKVRQQGLERHAIHAHEPGGAEAGDPVSVSVTDTDRWIRHRFSVTAQAVREAFAAYRFNDAAGAAYEFFWNDLCDWYLEASKLSIKGRTTPSATGPPPCSWTSW
jgi:valyl-tRNA synthetase